MAGCDRDHAAEAGRRAGEEQEEEQEQSLGGTSCGSLQGGGANCAPGGEAGAGKMGSPGRGRGPAGVAGQARSLWPDHEGSWTEGCPMGGPAQEKAAGCAPNWQHEPGAWTLGALQEDPAHLCSPVSP